MDVREPHENARVVHVVIRHVVHVGLRGDQLVALFERDHHPQRVRLGRLVDRLTGNELAADLPGLRTVRGALLEVGQRPCEFTHSIEADWLSWHTDLKEGS